MNRKSCLCSLFFAVVLLLTEAAAQVYVPPPVNYSAAIQSSSNMINLSTNIFNMNSARAAGRGSGVTRSSAVKSGVGSFRAEATSIMPQQLAAANTKDIKQQREMARFFNQQLQLFETQRRNAGQPTKDLAVALAYFIAISYNAANNKAIAVDEDVALLTNQINTALSSDAKLKQMSARDKQIAYESLAIGARTLVTMFDITSDEDEKTIQQLMMTGRENLKNLLGTTPERMNFGNSGLEIN